MGKKVKSHRSGDAKPLRIHQAIARNIGTAILSGVLAPGDNLGGEIEQSETLKVSRTAYREAMRILVAKGLLESRPRAGTHVNARSRWNFLDPEILAWMFTGKPDEAFIHDLFELRGILEPAAAAIAATRRTMDQLNEMREALDRMERNGLATSEGQKADQEFHRAILSATGNQALASLSSSVGAAVQWTTHFKERASANPRDSQADHEAVFEAIAAASPERASSAMAKLLDLALEDISRIWNS
ncbi:MAG: FadR/GntR family transcriptional regulator [Sphingomicrobium sp.]